MYNPMRMKKNKRNKHPIEHDVLNEQDVLSNAIHLKYFLINVIQLKN